MTTTDFSSGSRRGFLSAVLLFALAVRLLWGFWQPASGAALAALPDQVEYITVARNLLHGNGLSFIDPRFGDRVYAFRMPGYPIFVAGCGGNIRAVRLVQAIVDTSTVLAVYWLATLLMPTSRRRVSLLAALLVAINPLLIYFTALILSETLFVAMLMWGMALMVAGVGSQQRAGRVRVWLSGAVLLALSVLVRPSAALLPVVVGVGALFVNHRPMAAYQMSPRPRPLGWWPLPMGTTMLLLFGLALFPWAMRNYRVLHHWIWTDTNVGVTLYDGYNPDANGASNQQFVKNMPQLRLMDELGRSQYLSIRAMQFARQHSAALPQLALAKAGRTWSPMPLSEQYGSNRNRAILLTFSIPFDLLVLAGLCFGNLNKSAKVFLLLPAIYLTLIHAMTVGSLRYRLPAEPALAVLAASMFAAPTSDWKRAG